MSKSRCLPIVLFLVCTPPLLAQSRERHEREWNAKVEKMATHLSPTMRNHGVDLWVPGIKSSIYPHAQGNWVDDDGTVRYFAGPQDRLWLIRSE